MHRRLWLSVAMLAAGASLLVAANFASAAGNHATLKKGGIYKLGAIGASVAVDPQVAYVTTAWWLEYATAAKLYDYPDKSGPAGLKLVPSVASKFTVSRDGKTYTFTIRKGFRFSDGKPVTAKNFTYAIDRTANHDLNSPGAQFITDPNGSNLVGAAAVNAGHGTHVSGAVAKGNKLIIHLLRADGTFLSKITMPFFQATSTKLPLTKEIVNVSNIRTIPSAGPYAMSHHEVNKLTEITQNPFWKRGPGRNRPRNLTGVRVEWNTNEQTGFTRTQNNELDEGPLPPENVQQVRSQYGVNKSRYWVKPTSCTGYIPFNTSRSLFKGNVGLRKAINYAVSRRDYVNAVGLDGGSPWSHILSPSTPGATNKVLYPSSPNLTKAKKLAKGHFKDGNINLWYRSSGTVGPDQYQLIRRDLVRMGFDNSKIHGRGFSGATIYDAMGVKGNDADLGTGMGWCQDYPDPYDFINILLFGGFIQPENNVNYSYFNEPKWNKKMATAARKVGPARLKAYAKLDVDLMKNAAPMAPMRTYNSRYFLSNRVNPKSLVYQTVYQDWSIPALALK
jgi:ABC-type oligopeptide transport system substrate-binding subunit